MEFEHRKYGNKLKAVILEWSLLKICLDIYNKIKKPRGLKLMNQRLLVEASCYQFSPMKAHKISRKFYYFNKKHKKYSIPEQESPGIRVRAKSLTEATATEIFGQKNLQSHKSTISSPSKRHTCRKSIPQLLKIQSYSNLTHTEIQKSNKNERKNKQKELLKENLSYKRSSETSLNKIQHIYENQITKINNLRDQIQKIGQTQPSENPQQEIAFEKQGFNGIFLNPFHLSRRRNLVPISYKFKLKPFMNRFSEIMKLPIKQIDLMPIAKTIKTKE